jgi:archaemetzincin
MVKFAAGFHRIKAQEKVLALGADGEDSDKRVEFTARGHQEIPTPSHIDDWLAQYNESPQSYNQWRRLWAKLTTNRETAKVIYLIPIHAKEEIPKSSTLRRHQQQPATEALFSYTNLFYSGIQTKILPPVEILQKTKRKLIAIHKPMDSDETLEWDIESRVCHKYDTHKTHKNERQLRVSSILNVLEYILPEDAWCLCGITMEDLYDGNTDSFVCGMAAGGSHIGVFSFSRYVPQTISDLTPYELATLSPHFKLGEKRKTQPNEEDQEILSKTLLRRSCKTLVHEIAHMHAIGHCVYYNCAMNGSGHLHEDFEQSMHWCPVDVRKLAHILGMDQMQTHFSNLFQFYSTHGFIGDANWLINRFSLEYLTNTGEKVSINVNDSLYLYSLFKFGSAFQQSRTWIH